MRDEDSEEEERFVTMGVVCDWPTARGGLQLARGEHSSDLSAEGDSARACGIPDAGYLWLRGCLDCECLWRSARCRWNNAANRHGRRARLGRSGARTEDSASIGRGMSRPIHAGGTVEVNANPARRTILNEREERSPACPKLTCCGGGPTRHSTRRRPDLVMRNIFSHLSVVASIGRELPPRTASRSHRIAFEAQPPYTASRQSGGRRIGTVRIRIDR